MTGYILLIITLVWCGIVVADHVRIKKQVQNRLDLYNIKKELNRGH